jgi:hypothetical protein
MDPPEENNIDYATTIYDSERNENVHDHVDKRHRGDEFNNNLRGVDDDDDATNAALLSFGSSSLSLNPPDPPANYGFPYPSISTTAPLSNNNIIRSGDYAAIPKTTQRLPIDPVESIRSPGLLLMNTHSNSNGNDDVSMASDDGNRLHDDEDRSEGIIDNDDDECNNSVCSAISESSIKSAMYQLVFGRWRPPSPLTHVGGGKNSNGTISGGSGGGSVVGRYDAVDSKIEDMIRRSRLEAVIRSSKSEDGNSRDQSPMSSRLSDVDMDDDAIDN